MVDFDDVLRCPACGSPTTEITADYQPGSGCVGRAFCWHCRCEFKFQFELQPNLKKEQRHAKL
jgi:hypothetical protein